MIALETDIEITPTLIDDVHAQLLAKGVPLEDIGRATHALFDAPGNAAHVVGQLASGKTVDVGQLAPLIGIALAATGVGAPAGALVAAAIPVAETLGRALGILGGGGDEHCDWKVPSVRTGGKYKHEPYECRHGPRPWGPSDPKWVRFDDYIRDPGGYPRYSDWDRKSPWKDEQALVHGGEHAWFGTVATASEPIRGLHSAFIHAWKSNAEREINGYSRADDFSVLRSVVSAWNRAHAPSKVEYIDEGFNSYIGRILAGGGDDGTRHELLTVHVGPAVAEVKKVISLHVHARPKKKTIALHTGRLVADHGLTARRRITARRVYLAVAGALGGALLAGPWGVPVGAALGAWAVRK